MLANEPKRKVKGDYERRWMSDDYFDLIVWYESSGAGLHGFQLCYGKPDHERALTWRTLRGFSHHRVDTGEPAPFWGLTPILVPDGSFPVDEVVREFRARSRGVSAILRDFVLAKLVEFASGERRRTR